ncbi:uncharacterized protein N7482_000858 [Penicillium canariense]|uniref:Telomere replication protein EST3 n=1 Tax=Penicillium canariense TaxID=189055 RepID=A0A9W9LSI6_9EURO|nr:uncharacterized protein N7482_000858 [Penicillium canariense]KAJ5174981.1 hypothetical protein N7482_000858 [Penicillium canariense]
MNVAVPSAWLATFVEQCLGFYLGQTSRNGINVEDDGATLSFSKPGLNSEAVVLEWSVESPRDSALLMDADNQILAMFPRELSDPTQLQAPNPHSNETSPRKHLIQLMDFALIFTYSTSTPDVHLKVNRFCIKWQEGLVKFTPAKKLRKNQVVKVLLDRAKQAAKSSRPAIKPNGSRSPPSKSTGPVDQHMPQSSLSPSSTLKERETQQIFSQIPVQVPVHDHDMIHYNANMDRSLTRGTAELLQHLGPNPQPSSITSVGCSVHTQTQINGSVTSRSPLRVLAGGEPIANGAQHSPPLENRTFREDSISSQPQNGTTALCPLDSNEPDDAQFASKVANRSPSRKRHRDSVDLQSQPNCAESHVLQPPQEATGDLPSKKRQRIESIQERSPGPVAAYEPPFEIHHLKNDQQVNADDIPVIDPPLPRMNPWQGLSKIPASDVNIPKDQLDLLDGNLCWIPPAPGSPEPHGHVPPWLLTQWNSIAQRRHQSAKEDVHKKTFSRSATPISTQETTSISECEPEEEEVYSWSGSSAHGSPRNLPPESSPIRQPMSLRTDAGPSADDYIPGRKAENDNPRRPSDSDEILQPHRNKKGYPRNVSGGAVFEPIPTNEPENWKSDNVTTSIQSSLKDLGHSGDVEMQDSPVKPVSQNFDRGPMLSAEESLTASDTPESVVEQLENGSESESDDESVMENSIPFALGESLPPTQCSQAEQEPVGSASSHSGIIRYHVQVAVTPLTIHNRLYHGNPDNEQKEPGAPYPQFSSQGNKPSSQSRVPDTCLYPGSSERSQSTHETTESSSLRTEAVASPVEIAVPQTQPSTMNSHSQDTSSHSQHGVVLDSSEPAHCHQDYSSPGSTFNVKPLSQLCASSADLASSLLHEPTLQLMTQGYSNDPKGSSQVSPMGCYNPSDAGQDQTLSKSLQDMTRDTQHTSQAMPATQSAELVARRLGFIGDPEKSAEAQQVYKQFCTDYPSYAGDYGHFTELCSKLQDVRAQGLLQQSNMWDDFIIMNLQRYPSYLEEHTSRDPTETLKYELYFTSNFSRPVNKRRSLSGYGIEVAASQFVPHDIESLLASSQAYAPSQFIQGEAMDTLATSSADRFSHFHAHLSGGSTTSALYAFDGHLNPTQTDSDTSSAIVKLEGSEMNPDEAVYTQAIPTNSLDENPALLNFWSDAAAYIQAIETQKPNTQGELDDVSLVEVEETDHEEIDADDTRHETASVELGDETFVSATDEIPETEPEAELESEEENWFMSLRHMWTNTGPAWSDHPGTPLKAWAEADQNVLSERHRRGGAKVLLNEKGVIRRPIHR